MQRGATRRLPLVYSHKKAAVELVDLSICINIYKYTEKY